MEHKTEANINMRSFSLSKPLGAELLAFFQSSVLFCIAGEKKKVLNTGCGITVIAIFLLFFLMVVQGEFGDC